MRRFLIIAPEALAQSGSIGTTLLEQGDFYDTLLPVERYASWAPFSYPGIPSSPQDWSGLIVMGGSMSANDGKKFAFLPKIENLMRAFDNVGRPVLGVCLGAQIAARAFGGVVSDMGLLETGFVTVSLEPAALDDPVFSSLGSEITMFQNHYEAVRHCVGSVPLATGGACPLQAFRIGDRIYATQFHLEVTLDIARDWYRRFGEVLYADAPNMATDLDPTYMRYFKGQRATCRVLIERWSDLAPRISSA